ncbi:MAG: RIO1 family regulatory kinase/ATPase [Chloroflexota bacterium]
MSNQTVELMPELDSFFAGNLISDVLGLIKSGKEGSVYCCQATARSSYPLLAAKVYRPLKSRGFRNDALYREGRVVSDRRAGRALKKKTSFGKSVQHGTWMAAEYETLQLLHGAGADVPAVVAQAESATLMQYIGDVVSPADALRDVSLRPSEARPIFQRLLANIQLFLSHNLVHGDLSPYNILYWNGDITIIDFPQAVDARFNPNALSLLTRDLENVCSYFARYDIHANPMATATDLWQRYVHAEL